MGGVTLKDFENFFDKENEKLDEISKEKNSQLFYNFMMLEKFGCFKDKGNLKLWENDKKSFFKNIDKNVFEAYCDKEGITSVKDFLNRDLDKVLKQNQNLQKISNEKFVENFKIFSKCCVTFFDNELSFLNAVNEVGKIIYKERRKGKYNIFSFMVLVFYFLIKVSLSGKHDKNYIKNVLNKSYLSTYFCSRTEPDYNQKIDKMSEVISASINSFFTQ